MPQILERTLSRTRMEAACDPEARLSALLGPRFAKYRRDFARAESGARPPAPLHLDVDVATTCQLACPMCPAGGAFVPDFPGMGLFLDESLYQAALREGEKLNLPSLRLGMTGEPLLVPDVDRWAAEAKAAGLIDIALITNGQKLDAEMSLRLVESGLTRLMISVDAATRETYAKARPGGDFDLLVENIETFLAVRFASGSPLPLLRLSFVVMALNRHEIEAFRAKFSQMADWLVFQDYLDLSGDPSLAVQEARPSVSTGAPREIRTGPGPGRGHENEAKAKPGRGHESKAKPVRCPDPFTRLALMADGGLFPCCSDFARLAPLGWFPADSLESAWRSAAAEAIAKNLDHESCHKCLAASKRGAPDSDKKAAGRAS